MIEIGPAGPGRFGQLRARSRTEFVVAERLAPAAVRAGRHVSTASESDVETDLFGAGIRAEREFAAGAFDGLSIAGLRRTRACRYRGDSLPDDDFLRLRNSVEFRRGTGFALGDHPIEYGLFATIDVFADPPTGPTTGIDVPRAQLETGVVFGARPAMEDLENTAAAGRAQLPVCR